VQLPKRLYYIYAVVVSRIATMIAARRLNNFSSGRCAKEITEIYDIILT